MAPFQPQYSWRLTLLARHIAPGFKALFFAFDWYRDDAGKPIPGQSTFHVPDDYARRVAADVSE